MRSTSGPTTSPSASISVAATSAAPSSRAASYEAVAEVLFNEIDVDAYFLEYDDERSGDFAPLRFFPDDKTLVLGIVTSKRAELEDKDLLRARIHEAAEYVDLDRMCLSPQCGFSSTIHGNEITEDDQWAKLPHVVEVAESVVSRRRRRWTPADDTPPSGRPPRGDHSRGRTTSTAFACGDRPGVETCMTCERPPNAGRPARASSQLPGTAVTAAAEVDIGTDLHVVVAADLGRKAASTSSP